jgi:hypothetical protein
MKLGQECFIVRDGNGQALAYVYFEDEPGKTLRRRTSSPATKPGASPPTSPSCRGCYCFRGAAEYLPPFLNKIRRSS